MKAGSASKQSRSATTARACPLQSLQSSRGIARRLPSVNFTTNKSVPGPPYIPLRWREARAEASGCSIARLKSASVKPTLCREVLCSAMDGLPQPDKFLKMVCRSMQYLRTSDRFAFAGRIASSRSANPTVPSIRRSTITCVSPAKP